MVRTASAFGKVLKRFRHERKISQENLALDSGLDRTFISMLERGLRQPSLQTIIRLARTLEIRSAELVDEVEKMLYEDSKD